MSQLSPQESNNFKIPGTGNDIYGKHRLSMAVYFRDHILPKLTKYVTFIENGTLIGAWRNGKFIDHDDDFDFGILIDDIKEIDDIYNIIKDNLSSQYKYRKVTSYAHKIEIFEPEIGTYFLSEKYTDKQTKQKADYHYVTIDLQCYLKQYEKKYKTLYYINPVSTIVNIDMIVPMREIELEKEKFMCPGKTREFLENHYGSLDPRVKYNQKTGKYHV